MGNFIFFLVYIIGVLMGCIIMKCKTMWRKMFKDSMGQWMCPKCDLNYSTYDIIYDHIVPEGRRQCGGDYPNCISGCPLMDD